MATLTIRYDIPAPRFGAAADYLRGLALRDCARPLLGRSWPEGIHLAASRKSPGLNEGGRCENQDVLLGKSNPNLLR